MSLEFQRVKYGFVHVHYLSVVLYVICRKVILETETEMKSLRSEPALFLCIVAD